MIDIELIKKELAGLPSDTQVLLQTDGVHTTCEFHGNESDFVIPIYDIPYINSLLEKYGMSRSRVLRLEPGELYSWHRDPSPRMHIPVVVTLGSGMIVEEEVIRFEEGVPKLVDTTKFHTAFNPRKNKTRIHIVGVVA